MTRRRNPRVRSADQLDLLLDYQPPKNPLQAFPSEKVRAASLAASIARAVSVSLKECGRSRDQVAQEMSAYLGEAISENMLNAYASEARAEHIINVVRFVALIHATRDRRLLELVAERFDWAVVDRRDVLAIETAELEERKAKANRWFDREISWRRRQIKTGGGL